MKELRRIRRVPCVGPFSAGKRGNGEDLMKKKTGDGRFAQANREALIALGAYAVYFLWWYLSAYGLGDGDPKEYSHVLGMPSWFFYSCILGYPLITLLLWILMRLFFKVMPLDDEGGEWTDSPEAEKAGEKSATAPVRPDSGGEAMEKKA